MTLELLNRLEPLPPAAELPDPFDELLEDREASWRPAADVTEDDEAYVLTLDVPGLTHKDLSLQVHAGWLRVSGTRDASDGGRRTLHVAERPSGAFERWFRLPEDVNQDAIEASCRNGVLVIRLPKTDEAKARTIEVRED
jgi:HSP20 family protein